MVNAPEITDEHRKAYAAIRSLVSEHGYVDFVVRESLRGDGAFVCGMVWPDGDGSHAKCVGETVSRTKRPVRVELVGVQVDSLLHGFGWRVTDATFSPTPPHMRGIGPDEPETCYFIQDASGPIKIGKTGEKSAASRLKTLQTGNPRKLTLLTVTRAHSERSLHQRFAEERVAGEWFSPSERLLSFIEELRERA